MTKSGGAGLPGVPEARLALLHWGTCLFFQEHGVGKVGPRGSQSCWLTDSRHHLTPKTGAPANSRGRLTPSFLTGQMSAARHAAATSCTARSLGGDGASPAPG